MASYWHRFPQRRPRRQATDGIKAKSRRGRIGESWWSERFIAALEALTDAARLGRGRSYARTGQVMDLDVAPGLVTARVQGSRRTPYRVRIAVRPLTEPQWRRVEEAMAGQAIFLAALLAGEMPRDIEDAFAAAGLSLFPTDARDLDSECSCPDWANPCKHIAATAYILGEAFDEDPFLMFTLRGRDRETLLEHLRERRAAAVQPGDAGEAGEAIDDEARNETGDGASDPAATTRRRTTRRPRAASAAGPASQGVDAGEAMPIAAADEPALEAVLDDFWRAGRDPDPRPAAPHAVAVPDALLRELGPIPAEAGGAAVVDRLAAAYAGIVAAAARRALGDPD